MLQDLRAGVPARQPIACQPEMRPQRALALRQQFTGITAGTI